MATAMLFDLNLVVDFLEETCSAESGSRQAASFVR